MFKQTVSYLTSNRVFTKCARNVNNANIGIRGFIFHDNKKFQLQNATPVSFEPLDL